MLYTKYTVCVFGNKAFDDTYCSHYRKPSALETYWADFILTPSDRPKSVRNRCLIKVFDCAFVLSRCFLDFSVVVGTFAI